MIKVFNQTPHQDFVYYNRTLQCYSIPPPNTYKYSAVCRDVILNRNKQVNSNTSLLNAAEYALSHLIKSLVYDQYCPLPCDAHNMPPENMIKGDISNEYYS